MRIINTPRRQFGRTKLAALKNMRERNEKTLFDDGDIQNKSLYEILKGHVGESVFKGSSVNSFVSLIESMKKLKQEVSISELINQLCVDSGYEQYIRELGDEERLDNLSEFKRIANEFEENFGEKITLEEFLQQISLMSSEDTDATNETVKLMTIHASKGLEFSTVFITGFSEGIFPSSKTIEERKKMGLEEERRLCYVSITRAREFLFLLDSEGVSQQGIKKLPSRFLYEIGEKNYQRIGKIDERLEQECLGYIRHLNLQMQANILIEKDSLKTVEHHIFGHGKVLNFDTKKGVLLVKFDEVEQPRSIAVEYFNQKHEKIEKRQFDIKQIEQSISEDVFDDENNEEYDNQSVSTALIEFQNKDINCLEQQRILGQQDRIEQDEFLISKQISDELKEEIKKIPNQLENPDFPKKGWICMGVSDLGKPIATCELCGSQIIRYVHHMKHLETGRVLNCGCVCAGKLEGDIDKAQKREARFKNKEQRKINFLNKKWKRSAKGNQYIKTGQHLAILFCQNGKEWSFAIDNQYDKNKYTSIVAVKKAVFEQIDRLNEN